MPLCRMARGYCDIQLLLPTLKFSLVSSSRVNLEQFILEAAEVPPSRKCSTKNTGLRNHSITWVIRLNTQIADAAGGGVGGVLLTRKRSRGAPSIYLSVPGSNLVSSRSPPSYSPFSQTWFLHDLNSPHAVLTLGVDFSFDLFPLGTVLSRSQGPP